MLTKENHLSPYLGSSSFLAADGAELDSDVDLPPVITQSQNIYATFPMDHGLPARFSLGSPATPSIETWNQPLIKNEKYLQDFNHPHSPSNQTIMDYDDVAMPRESKRLYSSQLTSYNYHDDPDELLTLTSQLSSPLKKHASTTRSCIERNRPGIEPSAAPITGMSSSVNGIKKSPFMDDDSDSFITFARISAKPNTFRRALSSHSLPSLNLTGKSLHEPISLASPNIDWVERRSENANTTLFPRQTYLSSFFRFLSLTSTSKSNASPELTTPSLHVGPRLPRANNLWNIITAIPRLAICLIQYLISPWISSLSLPEFLLRKKSFGDTIGSGKYRRKKFASSILIIYGIFCVFMFGSWILLNMGLYHGNLTRSEDLKGDLLDRKIHYSAWGNFLSFIYPRENQIESSSKEDENDQWNLQLALKRRVNFPSSIEKTQAPLSPISHMARFSKFHSKSSKQDSEEITPILFQGTNNPQSNSITACLFSNQFWLDRISLFLRNWDGPVSLVIECFSSDRVEVIRRIEKLRDNDLSINQRVDFHLVTTPDGTQIQKLRNSERMLVNPIATNAHLNLARFFSRSDMVWLVGDARVLPSSGLYKLLLDHTHLRSRVLDYGDAIIVPNFAFNREKVVHPDSSWWNEGSNLNDLAQQYIDETLSSISLPFHQWPKTRQELLNLSTKSSIPNSNLTILTMYDQAWEPKKGPSNWTMWENSATTVDSRVTLVDEELQSSTDVNKRLKGGDELYSIVRYDLKYAPNVIVSREGQPWCTERFEYNKAACVYQMYLTGTELWVMPEAWSITIQQIPQNLKKNNDDETLKDLISSRLYSKFHQEACMHYGREFSSLGAWDDHRSKHAKAVCMHVLSSWGVGTFSSNIV